MDTAQTKLSAAEYAARTNYQGWQQEIERSKALESRVRKFIKYYDKRGAHQLGNGEAFKLYIEAKKILSE